MSMSDWRPDGLDAFFKSDYTYDDAALLAQLWNIPVVEAKKAIGHKILNGIENLLPDKLRHHAKVEDKTKLEDKVDANYWDDIRFKAYIKSDYTYDDAALLAELWNIDVLEAKKTIGYKVMKGLEKYLPDKIRDGSGGKVMHDSKFNLKALGMFVLSDYTYEDAEILARAWEVSILEAKELIGYKILNGDEKLLTDILFSDPEDD